MQALLWVAFGILLLLLALIIRTLIALFVDSRTKVTTSELPGESDGQFDYIIVGGGSSGAVLAMRLVQTSETARVLLVEAGSEDVSRMGSAFFKIPMAALAFQPTPYHWAYETDDQDELVMRGEHWGSGNGSRGRPLIQCRGKCLGGSSSLNLANWMRGRPEEYDAWAIPGWSFRELLPHFRAVEDLAGVPAHEDLTRAAPSAEPHAAAARIQVERLRTPHAISTAFVAACRRWLGASAVAPSHAIEAPSEGACLHWVTTRGGIRCSNAALLRSPPATAALASGRLRIVAGCHVLRILLANEEALSSSADGTSSAATAAKAEAPAPATAPPCATGVSVRTASGHTQTVRAMREVVLCAGAINSPKLLLLSGIGDAAELEAAGVLPSVQLPGVGRSLRDVAAVGVVAPTTHATLDKQLRTPWPYLRYLLTRGGPLASNTLEASAFVSACTLRREGALAPSTADAALLPQSLAEELAANAHLAQLAPPAMQLLVQPLLFPFASWGKFRDFVDGLRTGTLPSALSVHVVLLRPKSTGRVTLRGREPSLPPAIQPRYFTQPDDLRALVMGVRLTRRLLRSSTAELQIDGELLPTAAVGESDADIAEYVRANACHFNGSLCGTCRMGASAADKLAVVDAALRVRGVRGLRVADASVMPSLVSGQLNATVTAIAHKAAALLLADAEAPAVEVPVVASGGATSGDAVRQRSSSATRAAAAEML